MRNTALAPDAPATFEDMIAKGKALKDAGKATNAFLQQVGKTGDAYYSYPYLSAFGGGIFAVKPNGDYDPTKVIVDCARLGQGRGATWASSARTATSRRTSTSTPRQSLFATGKVPYYVTGPWAVDKAKGAGIKYAISPLPTIEGNKMQPFLGVQMFYVSAKAKNDAFAQEFVTNYVHEEGAPGRPLRRRAPAAGPQGRLRARSRRRTPTSRRGTRPARALCRCRTSRR